MGGIHQEQTIVCRVLDNIDQSGPGGNKRADNNNQYRWLQRNAMTHFTQATMYLGKNDGEYDVRCRRSSVGR